MAIVFPCHWSKSAVVLSLLNQPFYYFISTLKLRFCPLFKIPLFSQLKNIITFLPAAQNYNFPIC
ncbi:hypothetical protein Hdeb2414_s0012g00380481 [Helianthus debilis subsp. tardiflorus]